MGLFSTAEITRLRADQEASFPETASVITITRVADGMGGWTNTETGTASVTARRQPALRVGMETVQPGGVFALLDWLIGMPHGTVVREVDIIRFPDQDYQVKDVRAARSYEYAVWVDATVIR